MKGWGGSVDVEKYKEEANGFVYMKDSYKKL